MKCLGNILLSLEMAGKRLYNITIINASTFLSFIVAVHLYFVKGKALCKQAQNQQAKSSGLCKQLFFPSSHK
jgi:hypothetical protein